ncbi:MAG: RNA-binding S4 domain-containing protein [Prevotellaceae bacterium]|jgi:ribosome-associated heat shock protein Hsp15|nr:RNA-binding S4 domain-containing protein [Prevotellaceae bacterium]
MPSGEPSRLDKWLWAVRVYKTRSDATEACKLGRIFVNEVQAKASREVKANDTIRVKKSPVTYTYKVLGIPSTRQGAKIVHLYAENITPQEELDKLNVNNLTIFVQRDRGSGRPTKKERRDIENLMNKLK